MRDFNTSHLYLASLIIPLFLYFLGIIILYKYRKAILFSSILAIPQAFLGLLLVPVYWDPVKILFLGVGLEDFIFSFLSGGAVWMGIFFYMRNKVLFSFSLLLNLKKFILCTAFGLASLSILYFFDIKDMKNPFITMILLSLVILLYRSKYWIIAFIGALTFTFDYVLGMKIGFWIWPELISFWTLKNLSGVLFLEIPIEEVIWSFLYGLSWSLGISYVFDVQLKPFCKLQKTLDLKN